MQKLSLIILLFFVSLLNKVFAQTFSPLGQGFEYAVYTLYADTINNLIYAGGSFQAYGNGQPVHNIALWDGTTWDSLGSGVNDGGNISSIQKFNGEISVGGSFDLIGNITSMGFAIWNGVAWYSIGDISNYGNGAVRRIHIINNEFYVVGSFDTIAGIPANKIAKWNGVSWSTFPVLDSVGPGSPILVAANFNNELYVGGNFESHISPLMKDIAKWNGSTWTPVSNGLSGFITNVNDMIEFQGALYVGGWFELSTGDPGNFIAKWDGTSWSQVGTGLDGPVFAFQIFQNELYVGGGFTDAGGIPVNYIAKWDGIQWHNIPNANFNNAILCLTTLNNELYIGGGFKTVNSDTMNCITKYTPSVVTIGENKNVNEIFYIYLNPVMNELNVKINNNSLSEIILYDIASRKLLHQQFTNTLTLTTSHLSKGIYIYELRNKNGVIKKGKVVKE